MDKQTGGQNESKGEKKFIKTVSDYLFQLGAVEEDFLSYKLAINTPVGKLHIRIDLAGAHQRVSSIFGRFADPKRAREVVSCNPFSGKWNFHEYSSTDVFEAFKASLDQLLESKSRLLGLD